MNYYCTLFAADICDFVPCALQFTAVSPNPYMNLLGGYVNRHNNLSITKFSSPADGPA